MGSVIAMVLLIGRWVSSLPPTYKVAILAALIGWTASTTPAGFPSARKPPWKAIAAYVSDHHPGHQLAVTEVFTEWPLGYYLSPAPTFLVPGKPYGPTLFICRPGRDYGFRESGTLLRVWRHELIVLELWWITPPDARPDI
jgi:hypothetical protein